jgi:dTDP-4-amino-4,6-dideoxygalactose transaminase
MRMLADQGQGEQKYHHEAIGYNSRLDALQALALSSLLEKVESFNAARLRLADEYARNLPAERLQRRTAGGTPVYHLFVYRCTSPASRERTASALQTAGIQFGYHYPVPIHKQKAYAEFNDLRLPAAEALAGTLISLPMHPNLQPREIERVCEVISRVAG